MEDWRIHDRFRVLIIVTCEVLALIIIKRYDQSRVWVLEGVVGEIIQSLDDGCVAGDLIGYHASPELALRKGLKVKAGDDAKIVPATTKGEVQIRERVDIDVCNFAIRKNDLSAVSHILLISRLQWTCLIISHTIACPPVAARKERYTT